METALTFLVLMLVGTPISVCLCLSGLVYLWASDAHLLLSAFPVQLFAGVDSYGLIAIPLFILIGEIMNSGGITRRLVELALAFVGAVRGGLAYVNVLANMMVASIVGSATAQVAIMSQVMVPQMEKAGYDRTLAAGITVYGGMLGPIIPPSVMFVVYSVMAQVAVGDMLMAGLLPGLLLTGLFIALIALLGFWHNYPVSERRTLRERARAVWHSAPTLVIPVVIVGSIFSGAANPTEAAAVGAVAAALVGRFVTRELRLGQLPALLRRAALQAAAVLFMVAAAGVFSWLLIYGKVPQASAAWIQTVAHDPITFLLIVNLVLLLIGTVIDGIPGLIMTVPILLPVATEVYHIDPLHFGVVVVINLVLGLMSPPVGLCFFVASAVTGARPGPMFMVTLPFFFVSCLALVLVSVFPALTLALVR